MPGNNPHPLVALLGEVDTSQWAGVDVLNRGGSNVSLDADSATFDDVLALLNGCGSQSGRSLPEDVQSRWTANSGAGNLAVTLNDDDQIVLTASAEDFTVSAGINNIYFGADPAGYGLVGGSAPFVRTFDYAPWVRGAQVHGSTGRLEITPAVGTAFSIPRYVGTIQSLITHVRKFDESDADGTWSTLCLEDLDNTTNDTVARRIRWGIDGDGHVYTTRPSGVSAAVTWVSTSFRDRLGFTGLETESTSNGIVTLTAANPCPGCYFPTRPLETIEPITRETTGVLELSDGDICANHVGAIARWRVVFYVDGPADSRDTSRHWVERCFKEHWTRGSMLTLYQHWGDPRRALAGWQVNAEQPAYDLLYTSERDGYRGRLRCRIAADSPNERSLAWEGALRRRLPVEMHLVSVP